MTNIDLHQELKLLTEIPANEKIEFEALVRHHRESYIKPTEIFVDKVFDQHKELIEILKNKRASEAILQARELVWQEFLINESDFNTEVMKDLSSKLSTPRKIIESLSEEHIINRSGEELINGIIKVCGEYSGRVYPYIYTLSLSNTQSRRSRSGSTFENIIYKIYNLLEYPFDSQRKVGKNVFQSAGLGKMVDSILPGVESFSQRRDKVIIGTMKTSLRERWQEVSEEIQRTNIPKIYLLTVDDNISLSKAKQMSNHNIILVTPIDVAKSTKLTTMRNVISFEDYLFDEIPNFLSYWNEK